MFWWLRELLSCLKFLAITGTRRFLQSKRVYEFLLPGVAGLGFSILYLLVPGVFDSGFLKGLSSNVFQVMVFVVPFHLAALAAVSTYNSPTLCEKLPGNEAQLKVWSNEDNCYVYQVLTVRQYVSLLFGYLCSIGLIYVLIYIFLSSLDLSRYLTGHFGWLHTAALFGSFFFVFHYFTLTIYAITFLFDKVNKVRA